MLREAKGKGPLNPWLSSLFILSTLTLSSFVSLPQDKAQCLPRLPIPCVNLFHQYIEMDATPPRLSPLKRMKKALTLKQRKEPTSTDDDSSSFDTDAPQLNLPRVETRLEMHQTGGLFDSLTADRRVVSNSTSPPEGLYCARS